MTSCCAPRRSLASTSRPGSLRAAACQPTAEEAEEGQERVDTDGELTLPADEALGDLDEAEKDKLEAEVEARTWPTRKLTTSWGSERDRHQQLRRDPHRPRVEQADPRLVVGRGNEARDDQLPHAQAREGRPLLRAHSVPPRTGSATAGTSASATRASSASAAASR